MGIGNYFKAGKGEKGDKNSAAPSPSPQPKRTSRGVSSPSSFSEKAPSHDGDLQAPTPNFSSRPQSLSARSTRSNGSSMFLDDIKHEVMVNYLYQQQCSHLWVADGSGEIEGVLLRKTRGQYMACPPQLGNSPFAVACAALNVQVGISFSPRSMLKATSSHGSNSVR